MPKVTNVSADALHIPLDDLVLLPGASVDVSAEVAAGFAGNPFLQVSELSAPEPAPQSVPEPTTPEGQ